MAGVEWEESVPEKIHTKGRGEAGNFRRVKGEEKSGGSDITSLSSETFRAQVFRRTGSK